MSEYAVRRGSLYLWGIAFVFMLLYLYDTRIQYWIKPLNVEPRAVTPRGSLAEYEQNTIAIFNENKASVVYITTQTLRRDPWSYAVREIPRGTGTGFVWDTQGHIVTNFHVLEGASSAEVVLYDHKRYDVALVGASPDHDLAVLRLKKHVPYLRPMPLGTSHDLLVGQSVFAIGNPFGLDQTLTGGLVSQLNRRIESGNGWIIEDVIQTDAAINPGNSGGPLLDSAGRLIGVNTAISSPSGAYAGVGFAVPVDTVNRVVPQLLAKGRYTRPVLGVNVFDKISESILKPLGVEGVAILSVAPGSGAEKAGLKGMRTFKDGSIEPGDVIVAVEGRKIKNMNDLYSVLDRQQIGKVVNLQILRDGEIVTVGVELSAAAP